MDGGRLYGTLLFTHVTEWSNTVSTAHRTIQPPLLLSMGIYIYIINKNN